MVRNVQGSTGPRFLHRRRRIALFIVAALLLVVALVLSQLGTWLVVSDALEKADVIVVLSGPVPFRAIEGARLYTEGWAPEVWLTREAQPVRDRTMAELGITSLSSAKPIKGMHQKTRFSVTTEIVSIALQWDKIDTKSPSQPGCGSAVRLLPHFGSSRRQATSFDRRVVA